LEVSASSACLEGSNQLKRPLCGEVALSPLFGVADGGASCGARSLEREVLGGVLDNNLG
jgi:hypothetical protein